MRRAVLARSRLAVLTALAAVLLVGCGGSKLLQRHQHLGIPGPGVATTEGASSATSTSTSTSAGAAPAAGGGARTPQSLGFPSMDTKNTTRVPGTSAVEDAAAVALAVFPSTAPGTHPAAVALAPTDDWQAALAASSLMGAPFRAPLLLSGPGTLPPPTAAALGQLAPTGLPLPALKGMQAVTIGDVASPGNLKTASISGRDPFALAAAIDAFEARARGRESLDVVIASADQPAYAMPAAGYAAESGEPILFVHADSVPATTRTQLRAHHHPHLYVLGPPSAISEGVVAQLAKLGSVKRVGAQGPGANSVAFAGYRDPRCPIDKPCGHIPHSFGWAIRSPGHAYVLMGAADPLVAAAAAPLSSSGGYGPQLLLEDPNTLPRAVLNYFLDYATPGYNQQGPTAAVYNHAWLIGTRRQISLAVQAQVDSLLEVVAQK